MTIEEVLIENRIVVGQRLGQSGETCGWDFLECCLVGFISASKEVINLSGFAYKLALHYAISIRPVSAFELPFMAIITLQITIAITLLSSYVLVCVCLLA